MLPGTVLSLLVVASWSGAEKVIRETRKGKVKGRRVMVNALPLEIYEGIPYAEPPVGDLRFKLPVPRKPWDGISEALPRLSACSQPAHPVFPAEDVAVTEDCLHLTVWTPAVDNSRKVPVLVWLYGGGFTFGSASFSNSNATYLAALTGCVIVVMNYRLSILGFLNANTPDAPGNMGLHDQRLALKWVQENIEIFGGDPSLVTLFGISSGSQAVHIHVLSPMSKGLFKRAMMISGAMHSLDFFDPVHESTRKGNDIARVVGCARDGKDLLTHPEEVIQCLRLKPAHELVLVAYELAAPSFFPFSPTFHDQFLPKAPSVAVERGFSNDVDVVAGITSDEGSVVLVFPPVHTLLQEDLSAFDEDNLKRSLRGLINWRRRFDDPGMLEYYESKAAPGDLKALRRAYVDYIADRQFNCLAQFFAEKYSAKGNAVYSFIFGHVSPKSWRPSWIGVPHGGNMPFVFAEPFSDSENFAPEDKDITEHMARILATFAEYG